MCELYNTGQLLIKSGKCTELVKSIVFSVVRSGLRSVHMATIPSILNRLKYLDIGIYHVADTVKLEISPAINFRNFR